MEITDATPWPASCFTFDLARRPPRRADGEPKPASPDDPRAIVWLCQIALATRPADSIAAMLA